MELKVGLLLFIGNSDLVRRGGIFLSSLKIVKALSAITSYRRTNHILMPAMKPGSTSSHRRGPRSNTPHAADRDQGQGFNMWPC